MYCISPQVAANNPGRDKRLSFRLCTFYANYAPMYTFHRVFCNNCLSFFASHPSYVNFFSFSLFQPITHNYSRSQSFYSPLSKTQFRRIPDFRGYIYNPPPSWEGVSLSSTQPEDELSSFRSIPSRIYIIHAA